MNQLVRRSARTCEVITVLLFGVMSGFFFAFAADVAPAMAQLDGTTYITTQQWINRVVRNVLFGGVYFGATIVPFLTAAIVFWSGQRVRGTIWLAIALLYFVAVFWITRTVNVPINEELARWVPAAPPEHWMQFRDAWNSSNLVRAIAAFSSFTLSVFLLASPGKDWSTTDVGS